MRKSPGVEFVSASFRVNVQDWEKFLSVSDFKIGENFHIISNAVEIDLSKQSDVYI